LQQKSSRSSAVSLEDAAETPDKLHYLHSPIDVDMTKFRPCIDLHHGCVKQIVGGTLRDDVNSSHPEPLARGLVENYVAEQPAAWFAEKYRRDQLTGGHVIKLGPGNDEPARAALASYPGGLQIGGGIDAGNARQWLDAGASHVIVTSWVFDSAGQLSDARLRELVQAIGRERLVLDLSCRRQINEAGRPAWQIAMNRWQTITNVSIIAETLDYLAQFAVEFLIHAADVEGLCQGIDEDLVARLGQWSGLPMTYAGGVANMADVERVRDLSGGAVDVTVGSALDLFGGSGVSYDELVRWNQRNH
jgi:phosphoribosylformimino-5-aminoimidazole carboxamide ribotide isomerase